MRVPLKWLSEWIELPRSEEELAERFTMSGLEVDSIERTGPDLSGLCVGAVLERQPHPDADRLALCRVDVGEEEPVEIVCGAPNVAAGQKVAVARPGCRLPDGTKIKKTKIRGVVSLGMICSERELGLSEEHEGILVLPEESPAGEALDAVMRSGNTVLDIAILANRGDCTSILGMAREVRAYYGGEIRTPETRPDEASRATSDDIDVVIEDASGCHAYEARVVKGVSVEPSPSWLVERLVEAGVRSVNNVVDVSNYVMLEWGQPLHCFDLSKIRGGKIGVREAAPGEKLVSLDGQDRELEPGDIVIADGEGAVAIGGVIGGRDSEVSSSTRDVLIESALFEPSRIRRTARRLGISSDAAYRFERGVDPAGVRRAVDRAARLLAELAGGEVSRGVAGVNGKTAAGDRHVELDVRRVNRLLGSALDSAAVCEYLARLGIEVESPGAEHLYCLIPSYRNDLSCPEDLIEEVARLFGFDNIPPKEPRVEAGRASRPGLHRLADSVRDELCAEGLLEVLCFPFSDPKDLDRLGLEAEDLRRGQVLIENPLVEQDSVLRSSLLPSLLELARENFNRQVDAVALFEVARVFFRGKADALPVENLRATVLLTRGPEPGLWDLEKVPLFFVMKGIVERLCTRLGRGRAEFRGGETEPYLHPGAASAIAVAGHRVGCLGQLHPRVEEAFSLGATQAVVLDLDLDALLKRPIESPRYREVSRHPRVRRDLAVLLGRDQPAGEVVEAIRKEGGAGLVEVEVFDRYEGAGLPEGRVSVAFRLVFQRTDRTLKDAEVAKATDRIVQMLAHRFDGELR